MRRVAAVLGAALALAQGCGGGTPRETSDTQSVEAQSAETQEPAVTDPQPPETAETPEDPDMVGPIVRPRLDPGPPVITAGAVGAAEETAHPSDTVFGPGATTTPAAAPGPLAEPTSVVPDEQLVGRYELHGSVASSSGAIGWMRAYQLRADGTFQYSAYPSLTLNGRWRRVGRTGAHVELVHREMRNMDERKHVNRWRVEQDV